jgi:Trk K+ transport system NAD-binding subunit
MGETVGKQQSEIAPSIVPSEASPVIVCGLGRFGLRIVELLRAQQIPVVVITENSREDRKMRAYQLGARIVTGDFRFPEVRADAGIAQARALILATASDSMNLETALDTHNEAPQARIVMRVDSDKVAARLCNDFGIDAVLSPPVLAAPSFIQAALSPPPTPTTSPEISPASVSAFSKRMYEPRRLARRAFPTILVLSLLSLFVAGVVVFRAALGLSWTDAIYFTTTILTTVGFGDIHLLNESDNVKWFGTIVMFGGVMLIAALSSFLTNFFLSGAATQLRAEQIASRYRHHIILCGLGSVGIEIAEELLEAKHKVVVVDMQPEDIHIRALANRVPLIVGDATDPYVLRRAGIVHARSLISAVSNDLVNLEIGFMTQTVIEQIRPQRPLRIVLRCFDPDLAHRIHRRSNAYTLLSAAEIAAPIFVVQALKERT